MCYVGGCKENKGRKLLDGTKLDLNNIGFNPLTELNQLIQRNAVKHVVSYAKLTNFAQTCLNLRLPEYYFSYIWKLQSRLSLKVSLVA